MICTDFPIHIIKANKSFIDTQRASARINFETHVTYNNADACAICKTNDVLINRKYVFSIYAFEEQINVCVSAVALRVCMYIYRGE